MHLRLILLWDGESCRDGTGRPQAIDGRADDAAGKPGALTARVEAGDGWALPGDWIANDAYRRAAASLGAGEGGVAEEAAVEPAVHDGQTALECSDELLGQEGVQIGGDRRSATIARGHVPLAR